MIEKELRILLLEDDQEDVEAIEFILSRSGMKFKTQVVNSRKEFCKAMTSKADVILSDHFLQGFNSNEALEIVRQAGFPIPFILVTGAVSEEFAVETLKLGADDYVLKSNLSRLPASITNAIHQRESEKTKVNEATALRKEFDALLQSHHELERFVYTISHNLRSPLLSVLGIVGLAEVEDSSRDSHLGGYLKMIRESLLKLDGTIKDVLQYSRNAQQESNVSSFDLRELINAQLESVKFMPGSQHVLKNLMIDGPDTITSDRFRVDVMVSNLITNSIKYRDPAKPDSFLRIFVTVRKDRVTMVFSDNGIGIDRDYLSKVFDMFFRGTQASEGTGLGLYIVQEAVNFLKGRIEVESQLQRGTSFRIELPNLGS